MQKKVAIVTNATKYVGPAAVNALEKEFIVIANDESFNIISVKEQFQSIHPNVILFHEKMPQKLVSNVMLMFGRIDILINNDVYPLRFQLIEEVDKSDICEAVDYLFGYPFLMLSSVVKVMRKNINSYVIFVSSDSPSSPDVGYSVYGSVRAATTTLARAAAKELAKDSINVFVIAPNFYESETYYPKEVWEQNEKKEQLKEKLPIGRLGTENEMRALINYLVSGNADFLTGQIFHFNGGWLL